MIPYCIKRTKRTTCWKAIALATLYPKIVEYRCKKKVNEKYFHRDNENTSIVISALSSIVWCYAIWQLAIVWEWMHTAWMEILKLHEGNIADILHSFPVLKEAVQNTSRLKTFWTLFIETTVMLLSTSASPFLNDCILSVWRYSVK